LHLEFADAQLQSPNADVCVCAGDIATSGIVPSLKWLKEYVVSAMPVVFVAGNHEFYRASLLESVSEARAYADENGIHFLEQDSITISGTTFWGATLWTDFALFGRPDQGMAIAEASMNDFKRIKYSKQPYRRFRALDALRNHREGRSKLLDTLSAPRAGKIVVVTHHAPSMESLSPAFRNDQLSAAYASDLDDLITEYQPDLWVHGHIHQAVDYRIGNTRVMSNPRGYPDEPSFGLFNPSMVVEI
jgi:predicted phosphodiesterase